jgi:hypothetical protein
MARIDWLTACELAFLDRQDRLCVIGMTTHLPVPALPLELNQLMLVARLADLRSVEEVGVHVEVVTPAGLFSSPRDPGCLSIEMAGPFVFVTLRGLPLTEEGVYRFEVGLTEQPPNIVSIPVLMVGSSAKSLMGVN